MLGSGMRLSGGQSVRSRFHPQHRKMLWLVMLVTMLLFLLTLGSPHTAPGGAEHSAGHKGWPGLPDGT